MARNKSNKETLKRGKEFSSKVKSARKERNWTQSVLSEKSKVPLDTIRSIENGRIYSPGLFVALDLINALGGSLQSWFKEIKRGSK